MKNFTLSILLGLSHVAFNASAESFKIDDFRFGINDPSFDTWQTPQGAEKMNPSLFGTLVEGTYQGNNSTQVLINFDYFGGPVHVSTSFTNGGPSGVFDGNIEFGSKSPAGSIPGGPAPTIDLVGLTADMSSWFAQWNGTDFNQGNNTAWAACIAKNPPGLDQLSDIAMVTDNLDGTYRINWNSCITGDTFDGQIGFWQLDVTCTTCEQTVLGATDTLTASQNGGANTQTATVTGGDVTIVSSLGTTPAGVSFTWKPSNPSITDTDGNSTDGSFTFDPSGFATGNYIFTAIYQDSNTSPETKGSGEIAIRLVNTTTGDTDDSNGNGIENKDDAGLATTQLQATLGVNSTTFVLETSSGSLRLGKTAFCAGVAARITSAELEANASAICGTTNNSSDDLIKTVGIGGYYDFEISGLSLGETVDVVIPLTASIPKSAVYRKYTEVIGWATFITEGDDKLSSTTSTSEGICPAPSSTAYTAGLTQGDNCMRITITDGGQNDADNSANGLIKDPGAVAEINSGTEANLGSGCSLSGKPGSLSNHSEWLLIAAFIAWISFVARYRKQ